jgi:hypothetical protein
MASCDSWAGEMKRTRIVYKSLIIAATLLASSAAFAQGTNVQPGSSNSQTNSQVNNPSSAAQPQGQQQGQQQTTAQIANQIRKNLQQAGFKNIKLMPSSFIVRAEDQNNNPVMMVINPDSVTAVSAVSESAQNTTGQASHDGAGSSSSNSNKSGQ